MLVKLLVCLIAGLGAGIGTGLAGLSAAAVISPMLISFLGVPAYQAVGIAHLVSDVLASAISAYTYGKNKKLDLKRWLSDDGNCFNLYTCRELPFKFSSQSDDGEFFNLCDISCWG